MSILTNQEKYGKMVEALNDFYWDNDISPEETAARLEEFAGECVRLAKFIQSNNPDVDPRSPTLRAAVQSEQICPSCMGQGYMPAGTTANQMCRACKGTGISNRSGGG